MLISNITDTVESLSLLCPGPCNGSTLFKTQHVIRVHPQHCLTQPSNPLFIDWVPDMVISCNPGIPGLRVLALVTTPSRTFFLQIKISHASLSLLLLLKCHHSFLTLAPPSTISSAFLSRIFNTYYISYFYLLLFSVPFY